MNGKFLELASTFIDPGVPDPRTAFANAIRAWYGGATDVFLYFKGRVGLHALCRTLDLREGDEVVLPGYTCVVVPEAFLPFGVRPIYVDVDPATYNAGAEGILDALSPRTRMVLVQHTYGIAADVAPVVRECRPRGIVVVEDACHAFGTMVGDRPVGTLADAAFLSGQWNKPFSTGLGGILLTSNGSLGERLRADPAPMPGPAMEMELRSLILLHAATVTPRTYGWAQTAYRMLTAARLVTGSSSPDELAGRLPPDYFRSMSSAQAEAGIVAARSFALNVRHRERLQGIYGELLARAGFEPVRLAPGTVLSRYPVRVGNKPELVRRGLRAGLEIGSWFETPLHPIPIERHHSFGYEPGQCPDGERAARQVVNLPVNDRTGDDDAARCVDFLRRHGRPV
jgi:dTDP-4-amino-4,6-dideoxygalactose transaminase